MEIDFSHLLLLLLFGRAADDVQRAALCLLLQRLANCRCFLVSLMTRHSYDGNTHPWGQGEHSGLKSYHHGEFQPCRYRQSLSETADREAPVLVVMFKRLERMQWKRSA